VLKNMDADKRRKNAETWTLINAEKTQMNADFRVMPKNKEADEPIFFSHFIMDSVP